MKLILEDFTYQGEYFERIEIEDSNQEINLEAVKKTLDIAVEDRRK